MFEPLDWVFIIF